MKAFAFTLSRTPRPARWAIALSLTLALLPFGTGCETSCTVDEDPNPEVVSSGTTVGGVYESTSWDGEYQKFPPQKRYQFQHQLGAVPQEVSTFVGFHNPPIGDGGFGNVAEVAGNIVVIEGVTEEYIRVRNDTCETFYLRVVAIVATGLNGPDLD